MVGFNLGDGRCRMTLCTLSPETGFSFGLRTPQRRLYEYWSTDYKGHLSQIKRLLGQKFSDKELQSELWFLPFRVVEGLNGYPLIHCRFMGEDRAFSPIDILAMLISHLEAKKPRNYFDSSYCIAVPLYFTDQQRKDMLEAAKVAGLSSVSLLDETTAMVLGCKNSHYLGISNPTTRTVAFVDIGYASMQVCFAQFEMTSGPEIETIYGPESLDEVIRCTKILYQGFVRSLGARDFTKVLFMHFASLIRNKYNIDVYKSAIACVQLTDACEDLKEKLSKHDKASFCIENFSGSVDINGSINRKDFEIMSERILKRIEKALHRALLESQLDKTMLYSVKTIGNVGDGCQMPAVVNILRAVFGEEPTRMKVRYVARHSDELVARGCTIQSKEKRLIDRQITDLTRGVETSELESSGYSAKIKKDEYSERFLWRKAMDKEGHLLAFLGDFLGKNMHSIGRLTKTKDESYWLSSYRLYLYRLSKKFTEFRYLELQEATNNFHESFKLGEGGFGVVYKGILKETIVAIKILKEGSSQGEEEFNQEVKTLSKIWHPNLVKLIGACAEVHALIYEYLPNGSLEDHLRCKNNAPPLSWQARVHIAFEICSALSFLHSRIPHGIVHGDLKPDNILLDENDTSKLCDFGLCRELNWTASASIPCHWTDCPKGTLAYMDPEYLSTGKITPQYDVYSFGIILLRLVTCEDPRGIRNLVEEAQKKGALKTLVDASAGPWPFKEAKKMISLGLRCSDPIRKNRPDLSTRVMKEIKSMLEVASTSPSDAISLFSRLMHL